MKLSRGEGVRVAIIDSGIDARHPSLAAGVQGYIEIRPADGCAEFVYEDGSHTDEAGHGTSCAVLVRGLAPRCELYSVKVLGARCLGRAGALMAGMRWAIDNGMHVCNLSLGTVRAEHADEMRRITDTASRQNVILVAAANDRGVPSYPASCETVISVAKHPVPDPLRFWSGAPEGPDFVAWGVDVPLQSTDGNWFLGNGSSLAAAHMSGLIAAVLGNSPGLNVWQMKAALRELSASGDQLTHDAHRITRQRARRG